MNVPGEGFSSMNPRMHGNKTLSSLGSHVFVGETNVTEEGISDETKTFNKGNESDRVGSGVDSSDEGEIVNFFLGGTAEFDLFLFHAAVHVEGFTFEAACHLDSN